MNIFIIIYIFGATEKPLVKFCLKRTRFVTSYKNIISTITLNIVFFAQDNELEPLQCDIYVNICGFGYFWSPSTTISLTFDWKRPELTRRYRKIILLHDNAKTLYNRWIEQPAPSVTLRILHSRIIASSGRWRAASMVNCSKISKLFKKKKKKRWMNRAQSRSKHVFHIYNI